MKSFSQLFSLFSLWCSAATKSLKVYLFDKGVWCQEERAVSDLVTAELHKENT